MSTQMIIRLDKELKEKASRLAKAEGKNVSAVVRELLQEYVSMRDMATYLEGIWDEAGEAMRAAGFGAKDVVSAILDYRTQK